MADTLINPSISAYLGRGLGKGFSAISKPISKAMPWLASISNADAAYSDADKAVEAYSRGNVKQGLINTGSAMGNTMGTHPWLSPIVLATRLAAEQAGTAAGELEQGNKGRSLWHGALAASNLIPFKSDMGSIIGRAVTKPGTLGNAINALNFPATLLPTGSNDQEKATQRQYQALANDPRYMAKQQARFDIAQANDATTMQNATDMVEGFRQDPPYTTGTVSDQMERLQQVSQQRMPRPVTTAQILSGDPHVAFTQRDLKAPIHGLSVPYQERSNRVAAINRFEQARLAGAAQRGIDSNSQLVGSSIQDGR